MLKDKSIVVHLSGGLGNQLFQFATGLSLSKITGKELYLNINLYKNPIIRNRGNYAYLSKRKYELGDFEDLAEIKIDKSPTPRDGRFERLIDFLDEDGKRRFGMATELSWLQGNWINPGQINRLFGYFMSPKYFPNIGFENRFQKLSYPLEEKSRELIQKLSEENSIAVHVRLTDYLSQINYVVPSEEYYLSAIKYLQETIGLESKVYLFTDDIKTLKNRFPRLFSTGECLSQADDISPSENLLLMSKSSAYVCSNSTYSWWATRLSGVQKNRIVYPSHFYVDSSLPAATPDLWDDGSIAIDFLTGKKI